MVRNTISEVIREADELDHFLLSRGLRKVKAFQSLLLGERGACLGDEVTDIPITISNIILDNQNNILINKHYK
jgi:hypothetical protein